jgi:protein SCO1/2
LKDYFSDQRPVILSLVYYSCPSLCNFHLNGVFDVLKKVDWPLGDKYKLVTLSFDPSETAEVAAAKRRNYLQLLGQPKAEKGIHFLTASKETILAVTGQVGFNYQWDEASQQWAHASAAIVLSPDGQISRYLHGIQFEAKDVKLALSDATEGRIGSFVDQMIWYCFMYDPKASKYTIYSFRLVQVASGLMLVLLLAWFVPFWRKQRAH